jgi:hypothetical protein
LYQIAEKARILEMPGAPVEDRQYQVDLKGVSAATGHWGQLQRKQTLRARLSSKLQLKTQGQNPALLWNYKSAEGVREQDVWIQPLIDRMELSIGLAPAIVYERGLDNPCKCIVIAGHAAEVNFLADFGINISVLQMACLRNIIGQWTALVSQVDEYAKVNAAAASSPPYSQQQKANLAEGASTGDSSYCPDDEEEDKDGRDSGTDSFNRFPRFWRPKKCRPNARSHYGGKGGRPYISVPQKRRNLADIEAGKHFHQRDMTPLQFLLTSRVITVKVFDVKYGANSVAEEVIPLALFLLTQPHFSIFIGEKEQRMETSVFELSVRLGSPLSSTCCKIIT